MKSFINIAVKNKFNNYPTSIKKKLMTIRQFIFDIANENDDIGGLEETLKWEQPSYLTSKPKSGTTIRLDHIESSEIAIFVHCQTTLIAEFKEVYPEFKYDGNRAILLDSKTKLPDKEIKHFIYLALTYHQRKSTGIGI